MKLNVLCKSEEKTISNLETKNKQINNLMEKSHKFQHDKNTCTI